MVYYTILVQIFYLLSGSADIGIDLDVGGNVKKGADDNTTFKVIIIWFLLQMEQVMASSAEEESQFYIIMDNGKTVNSTTVNMQLIMDE